MCSSDLTAYWLTIAREQFEALPFSTTERLNGLHGVSYALSQLACVFLMCDRRDIGSAVDTGLETMQFNPTIFIYDNFPGGIGLSRPLYEISGQVLSATEEMIRSCGCDAGCPSCVGPGPGARDAALAILGLLQHA